MTIKTIVLILAVIAALVGVYFVIIDDQPRLAKASFIFSVIAFLYALVPDSNEYKLPEEKEDNKESTMASLPDGNDEPFISIVDEIESISYTDQDVFSVDDNEILGDSFSGNIILDGQEDYYVYCPTISGTYRFDFDSDDVRANYKFYINSSNGETIASSFYSDRGKTVELTAGQKYYITIQQSVGKAKYTVTIGIPNNVKVVESLNIAGTITYVDQRDEYKYTAPITGQYRFDFSSSDAQSEYRFYIYTSNNEQLATAFYRDGGKSIELESGCTYTIIVQQITNCMDYVINIGIPHEIQAIVGNRFSGSITYEDQLDSYTYTPPVTGQYRFDFISDDVECNYRFYMYTSNNECIVSNFFSDYGKTIDLVAGAEYRIEILQAIGFENYTIEIGIPNEITKVKNDTILGTIEYTDQEDVYTYSAPCSGTYMFSFDTNNVDTNYRFKLISSINEQLVSAFYSDQSKTVELEEGQVYTIKVIQFTGFPSYQININRMLKEYNSASW